MTSIHDIPPQATLSYVNIPTRWMLLVEDFGIVMGMFGSLIYALLFHYKLVLVTHCQVPQFFPSFSSVIGNRFPELFIWRLGMLILLPCRFFDCWVYHWWATNQQSYYQPASEYKIRVESNPQLHGSPNSSPTMSANSSMNAFEMHAFGESEKFEKTSLRYSPSGTNSGPTTSVKNNKKHVEYHPQLYIAQKYQPVSWGRYLLSLAQSFTMFVEYLGLTMLSFVSSQENFLMHEIGFILYLVFSQLHCICNFILCFQQWKLKGAPFYMQIAKCVCWAINIAAIFGAKYFFTRHNTYCEPNIYSWFGICEYTLVTFNIIMHNLRIVEGTWLGTISIGLYFPSYKALTHPANFDVINEDPSEREWLMSNPAAIQRNAAGTAHPLEAARLKSPGMSSNSAMDYYTDDSDVDDLNNPIDYNPTQSIHNVASSAITARKNGNNRGDYDVEL